ncbi:TRZ/ATZ family hydrolase, partial [Pseudomonas syringae pv. tagetis]
MPNATATLDLLLLPAWLVPVETAGVVLQDHGICIRDGCIVYLGPRAESLRINGAQVEELPGMLVRPVLINA